MEDQNSSLKTPKKRDIKKNKLDKKEKAKKACRKKEKRSHHKSQFYNLPSPEEVDNQNSEYDNLLAEFNDEARQKEANKERGYQSELRKNCWSCVNGVCRSYDCFISQNQSFKLN